MAPARAAQVDHRGRAPQQHVRGAQPPRHQALRHHRAVDHRRRRAAAAHRGAGQARRRGAPPPPSSPRSPADDPAGPADRARRRRRRCSSPGPSWCCSRRGRPDAPSPPRGRRCRRRCARSATSTSRTTPPTPPRWKTPPTAPRRAARRPDRRRPPRPPVRSAPPPPGCPTRWWCRCSPAVVSAGQARCAGLVVFLRDCQGSAYFAAVEDDAPAQPPLLGFPRSAGEQAAASWAGRRSARYTDSPAAPALGDERCAGALAPGAVTRRAADQGHIIAQTAGRRSQHGVARASPRLAGSPWRRCAAAARRARRHGQPPSRPRPSIDPRPAGPWPASSPPPRSRTTPRCQLWLATTTDTTDLTELVYVYSGLGTTRRHLLGGAGLDVAAVNGPDATHADVTLTGDIVWCLGKAPNDPRRPAARSTAFRGSAHLRGGLRSTALAGRHRHQRQQRPRPEPAGVADRRSADATPT